MKPTYNKEIIAILGLILCLSFVYSQEENRATQDIMFEDPDLFFTLPGGSVLVGYPSSKNKQNIENKNSLAMRWYSPGLPMFVRNKEKKIYEIVRVGKDVYLYFYILMMNTSHRQALAKEATNVYKNQVNGTIEQHQIHAVPIDYCKGIIQITDEQGRKNVLHGEVINLFCSPLQLKFDVSKADTALLETLIEQGLLITCDYGFGGIKEERNTLLIKLQELQDFDIENKIFGEGSHVYVSRNQLGELGAMVYRFLEISEQYQVPEQKFSDKFIGDLIAQASTGVFEQVPYTQAIENISNLMLLDRNDLKADHVKKAMQKIFKLDERGEKKFLKLDTSLRDTNENSSETQAKSAGGAKLAVFDINGSIDYVRKNQEKWEKEEKKLQEQLNELNTKSQSDIQWEIEGDMVIPKSVKVSVLSKAKFQKMVTVSRQTIFQKRANKKFTIELKTHKDVWGCPACQEKGFLVCQVCGGKASTDCTACNKTGLFKKTRTETYTVQVLYTVQVPDTPGQVTCPTCGGNGASREECPMCGGKGFTHGGGSGTNYSPCSTCGNKKWRGRKPCSSCSGSGEVSQARTRPETRYRDEPRTKTVEYVEKCPTCKGGQIPCTNPECMNGRVRCKACDGTGK